MSSLIPHVFFRLRLYTGPALCQSILKLLYTGLSLCIAILVYLGTGLGTSLFLGRGHSPLPSLRCKLLRPPVSLQTESVYICIASEMAFCLPPPQTLPSRLATSLDTDVKLFSGEGAQTYPYYIRL